MEQLQREQNVIEESINNRQSSVKLKNSDVNSFIKKPDDRFKSQNKPRRKANIELNEEVINDIGNNQEDYIAKNYKGYIAIGKALRDSSNGRNNPLMDKSVFEKYFGVGSVGHDNVIVTTCGIDGLFLK